MPRAEFRVRERDLAGRIGELRLKRGIIETPYLFPVIDLSRQELPVSEIKEIGFNAVITNAYLLYKRGFSQALRDVLGSDVIAMTDSGAYQLMEYGSIDIDNETIIEYQKRIDSDIAVILDYPTGDSLDRAFAEKTVEITLSRAKDSLPKLDFENRAWVLPIQGGVHLDLLNKSAELSASLDYDIYALGSPTRMMESYNYEVVADMLVTVKNKLPYLKPLHLFGGGHPMLIPFAVALGADLFDSASYMLFARDNRYMTEKGTKRLEDLDYLPCSCPVCSRFTAKELMEMEQNERTRLLAKHNLYIVMSVLRKTKQAIVEGRLWELLEEFSRGHPSLYSLLTYISKRHYLYIENRTPSLPMRPSSVFAFGEESLSNPYIYRSRKFLLERYAPPPSRKELVLRPRLSLTITDEAVPDKEDVHLVYYDHIMSVPVDVARLYPEGHVVVPKAFLYEEELYMKAIRNAVEYALRKKMFYQKITLEVCYEWLDASLKTLREYQFFNIKPVMCLNRVES